MSDATDVRGFVDDLREATLQRAAAMTRDQVEHALRSQGLPDTEARWAADKVVSDDAFVSGVHMGQAALMVELGHRGMLLTDDDAAALQAVLDLATERDGDEGLDAALGLEAGDGDAGE